MAVKKLNTSGALSVAEATCLTDMLVVQLAQSSLAQQARGSAFSLVPHRVYSAGPPAALSA